MNSEHTVFAIFWVCLAIVILAVIGMVCFIESVQIPHGSRETIARIEACTHDSNVSSCIRLNGH